MFPLSNFHRKFSHPALGGFCSNCEQKRFPYTHPTERIDTLQFHRGVFVVSCRYEGRLESYVPSVVHLPVTVHQLVHVFCLLSPHEVLFLLIKIETTCSGVPHLEFPGGGVNVSVQSGFPLSIPL